ncbi:hypothetical protein [Iningainema tapete]|uniref:Uncharacterized protein n=1 Tax=Iningainema tapete BLCC-T55 TaxID=2748662 RepID=A0A8J7C955_9CYAN|nr:hypothetical protein [Iningainema tapete]MBD2770640.1 hypothetical protein [Iningainema tapete BLCC-T55]
MKLQLSDVIATLALITSLFSIWIQDRGVRKQLLVANVSEYTKRYQEIILNLPKSVIFDDFNLASLDMAEQDKILRYMWIYFDLCYEEYSIYNDLRLVNKTLWKRWKSGMQSSFDRPAFQQSWYLISQNTTYPRPFVNFINSMIKNERVKNKNIFIQFILGLTH